jgi:hypothetical protein
VLRRPVETAGEDRKWPAHGQNDEIDPQLSRAGSKDVIVLAAAGRRSQRRIDALQDGTRRQS